MFDDQPTTNQGAGQAPPNLPLGEVDDMFADTEAVPAASFEYTVPTESTRSAAAHPDLIREMPPTMPPSSAISAGVLKPKMPPVSDVPEETVHGAPTYGSGAIKEPLLAKRLLIGLVVVVVFGGLGFGGWYAYSYFAKTRSAQPAKVLTTATVNQDALQVTETPVVETSSASGQNGTSAVDQSLLFGEPIDTDADNLDDTREASIGTDPRNWDTDGDELSDGDEVIIWKTQPLNPDTDGDTFLDGQEVKNGYSPTGPGKIFQPPTEQGN